MPTNAGSMFLGSDNDFSASRLLISPQFDCSGEMERNPSLLPRSPSTAAIPTCKFHRKRRRCSASNGSPRLVPGDGEGRCCGRGKAFCEGVGHAASKAYLLTGLAFTLLRYLGLGYRWITQVLALGCYGLLLSPGIFQVAFYYFSSKQIRRGVVYGDQPRNTLDLYLPKNSVGLKPVVAFVTGGAWIIGHKAWGCLIGQQLSERDIIVACIDYRNFPHGTISDMVEDASQGISFVCNHISEYGGDPNRIHIMGQSAGAHISSCVLLKHAIKEACEGEKTSWSVSQIKSYLGLSGVYNLFNLVEHLHSRGLYHSIFSSIMEGEHSLQRFSPEVMVQDQNSRNAVTLLPPITLFHGTNDYSIPSDESKNFADTLQKLGVKAKSVLYEGRTHTDLFLQDPMRGGKDELFEDLVNHIHAGNSEALSNHTKAAPRRRLVPETMLKMARRISPF